MAASANQSFLVRGFEPADRTRIRAISCATAFHGVLPERTCRVDCRLLADLLTRYYTDCEPESILVAESGGRVVGYIMGAVSTRSFSRAMLRLVLFKTIPGILLGRYRINSQGLVILAVLLAGTVKGERDPDLEEEYPAHLHINIDDECRQAGLGSKLMTAWFQRLKEKQIKGAHLSTNSANEGAIRFFRRFGFQRCHRRRSTFWSFAYGRPVYVEIFARKTFSV
ncbi:MAG: GNAT family N-acetyltransferase [Candidatus Ratteibacteria bacterium]|jgi:ribosomal protein S18 acetylase RimI-like enzyme